MKNMFRFFGELEIKYKMLVFAAVLLVLVGILGIVVAIKMLPQEQKIENIFDDSESEESKNDEDSEEKDTGDSSEDKEADSSDKNNSSFNQNEEINQGINQGQTQSQVKDIDYSRLATTLDGGSWNLSGHLQGATADEDMTYLYMSYNDRLVKVDMHSGEVVASMTGLAGGHLGDLAYYNGDVYASLEFSSVNKYYVAVIHAAQLTEMDMDYKTPGLMTAMYMHEMETLIEEDLFGAYGIDGTAFGKLPGDQSGKKYLIVACGLGTDTTRSDNNYQVLMAFDPKDFQGEAINMNGNLHKTGPQISRKFFVYTGHTTYGVQNLEYDADTGDYWLCCYPGDKPEFPDYTVFVVNGDVAPRTTKLALGTNPDHGDIYGEVLTLGRVGICHEPTGIWGFPSIPNAGSVGFVSIGNDYFYIGTQGTTITGLQFGKAILYRLNRQTYTFEKVNR